MIKQLYQLSPETVEFPNPELALDEPDGLLAIGGDLSVERIKNAYNTGVFPWFSDYEPIMWWSPSMRGVIELNEFHISRSLKKHLKRFPVRVTINHAFAHVINACREQRIDAEGTWITEQMMHAYIEAHHQALAHSLEIWHEDELVAGLYGIMQNGIFCGESMFHQVSNGSKLAMWALVNWLKKHQAHFIDCQLENPYLITLGAKVIPRREFLTRLKLAHSYVPKKDMWQPQELINIYD